jgi:hypothetical protein
MPIRAFRAMAGIAQADKAPMIVGDIGMDEDAERSSITSTTRLL